MTVKFIINYYITIEVKLDFPHKLTTAVDIAINKVEQQGITIGKGAEVFVDGERMGVL